MQRATNRQYNLKKVNNWKTIIENIYKSIVAKTMWGHTPKDSIER